MDGPPWWEVLWPWYHVCRQRLEHRYRCPREDIEDALSRALLECALLPTFPAPENPGSVLYQAAKHRLFDGHRTATRQATLRTHYLHPAPTPSPEAEVQQQHDAAWYWEQLVPSQQQRLVLALEVGVTEAARILGCHPGAVKAGLHKMRQRLQTVRAREAGR